MNKYIVKLPENRVRRNYKGGAGLDMFKRKPVCEDGGQPEEWILSTVEARNPGMAPVPDEGLSYVFDASGNKLPLSELISKDPGFYLGKAHYKRLGLNIGFLPKLLDSSIRLHVQAHPTREYARKFLNSPWGKLECYYIVGVRPGYKPYIRLGFQKAPTREEWRRIILEQDIKSMDACFERIPIETGQVWFVPGGLPHAIGEGVLMVEVMEPSDLVVRCEFEREGIVVPPEARFMGGDIEDALDIFDYTPYSEAEIEKKNRVIPYVIDKGPGHTLEKLVDNKITDCFEMEKLTVGGNTAIAQDERFHTGIVCSGKVRITCNGEGFSLQQGECYFASSACGSIEYAAFDETGSEICIIKPGCGT